MNHRVRTSLNICRRCKRHHWDAWIYTFFNYRASAGFTIRLTFHYNDPTDVSQDQTDHEKKKHTALTFAYHPNPASERSKENERESRYLVYISLINYVFNFCAVRFILVIPFCWFCSFAWSFQRLCAHLKGLTLSLVMLSCLQDCLIYARFDSFILVHSLRLKMSDDEEMDAKVFCKWVACARGITFNQCFV